MPTCTEVIKSAFGVEHTAGTAATGGRKVARKLGYPVKTDQLRSARHEKTGALGVERIHGREGSWAFKPNLGHEFIGSDGSQVKRRPLPVSELTRKGEHVRNTAIVGGFAAPFVVPPAVNAARAKRQHSKTVTKAYTPGSITYHQENANFHRRKKTTADRRLGVGSAVLGTGAALALHPPQGVVQLRRLGVAGAAAGGVVAGQALASRSHHAGRQNHHTKLAQNARLQRTPQLAEAVRKPTRPKAPHRAR